MRTVPSSRPWRIALCAIASSARSSVARLACASITPPFSTVDLDAARRRGGAHAIAEVAQEFVGIERFLLARIHLGPRRCQQLVHELFESRPLTCDRRQGGSILVAGALAAQCELGFRPQYCQRRSQLVRCIGNETALAGERCFQSLQHKNVRRDATRRDRSEDDQEETDAHRDHRSGPVEVADPLIRLPHGDGSKDVIVARHGDRNALRESGLRRRRRRIAGDLASAGIVHAERRVGLERVEGSQIAGSARCGRDARRPSTRLLARRNAGGR